MPTKEEFKDTINKVGQKIDKAGHKLDDFVEEKAEKHSFTKFQVWLGIGIAVLAAIGIYYLL